MGYTTFENNGQPALNNTVLNNMQVELMELVFPIGSTYITQENTNPSTILNFGTWERLKGKVCLGVDEDDEDLKIIGKTGGEKTHKLTVDEMPAHSHNINTANGQGNMQWGYTFNYEGKAGYSGLMENKGKSLAHNNMQPYEVVGYMWIRRA